MDIVRRVRSPHPVVWVLVAAVVAGSVVVIVRRVADMPGDRLPNGIVIDRVSRSPFDAREYRLIVTDLGALGWGCVSLFAGLPGGGWERVWEHCECDADEPVEMTWLGATSVRVVFSDPAATGRSRIVVELPGVLADRR